jgi:hypothetical protein
MTDNSYRERERDREIGREREREVQILVHHENITILKSYIY